ncbi:hypothetical protein [Psychrobacter vallis]|uniref:hypothetical protein n=1 Tax=Psychrobacter vallis TaxID=248451 RepID=UPI0019184164|nr:hypothetical protein [Psychrobacter vallis]
MAKINYKLVLSVTDCDLIMDNNKVILKEMNEVMLSQTDDIGRNAVARCMAMVVSNFMYANDEKFRLSIEPRE